MVIGDNLILLAIFTTLLAKISFYWRISLSYWRKSIFIGELEIPCIFFQLLTQKMHTILKMVCIFSSILTAAAVAAHED